MTNSCQLPARNMPWGILRWLALAIAIAVGSMVIPAASPSSAVSPSPFFVTDVNPDASTVPQPYNGDTAGRVNGLAVNPQAPNILYAASEFGGIYRTSDGGQNWDYLAGHTPYVTWDVAVAPSCTDGRDNGGADGADRADPDCDDHNNPNDGEDGGLASVVYATSFYDGLTNSQAGINVSYDGGATWTHPTVNAPGTACIPTPATGLRGDDAGWTEPSAYGISVRPDVGRKVFIGTKCGVAISLDSGSAWTHVDPNPTFPGGRVWDVISHGPSGVLDVCGDEGHFRSHDDGVTWVDMDARSPGASRLPGTTAGSLHENCSITASPLDPDVLVVALRQRLYESTDGGMTWRIIGFLASARLPWLNSNLSDASPDPICTDSVDSDVPADGVINDGCAPVGTEKEDRNQCGNDLDDDGDNVADDGCGGAEPPAAGTNQPEVLNTCSNNTDDDDLDGKINDGCPTRSNPETADMCAGAGDGRDDDGDGTVDDGCGGGDPAADGAEATCNDAVDNDKDGFVNDGCAAFDNPNLSTTINSEGANDLDLDGTPDLNQCDDDKDSESDGSTVTGRINDGCPGRSFDLWIGDGFNLVRQPCTTTVAAGAGARVSCAEAPADCGDAVDDDGDGFLDDGCPSTGTEENNPANACGAGSTSACRSPAACFNAVDDDGDGVADDGCTFGFVADFGAHNDSGDVEFHPQSAVPQCALYYANDGGVYWNASCSDRAEAGAECTNAVDDDDDNNDGVIAGPGDVRNDGCPAIGPAEDQCDNNLSDDGLDGAVNDGCIWSRIQSGMHGQWLWDIAGASQCEDNVSDDDDNGDGANTGDTVNDGCRQIGATAESGAQCNNTTNDDSGDDALINDGCPAVGDAESIDVLLGAQDVGLSFTKDGGSNWANTQCCDVFDIVADANQAVYTVCCFAGGAGKVFTAVLADGTPEFGLQCFNGLDEDADGTPNDGCRVEAPNQPPGGGNVIRRFQTFDSIDQFGPGKYVIVGANGNVYITQDNFASPMTQLTGGSPSTPPSACGVQASVDPNTNIPTFYVMTVHCNDRHDDDRDGQLNEDATDGLNNDGDGNEDGTFAPPGAGNCIDTVDNDGNGDIDSADPQCAPFIDEDPGGEIWKYTNTSGGTWEQADTGLVSVGMFAVHPRDPNRLYASELKVTGFEMKQSSDGGDSWSDDDDLEHLLGGGALVKDVSTSGGLSSTTNGTYAQPTMLEISPHFSGSGTVILAGGMDSGVFVSSNNGADWNKLAVVARCNNSIDEDGDGFTDDGCLDSGVAAQGTPERDQEIPRPQDAYFDSSGIFYIGTQGLGVLKVTGLGPSAVTISNLQKECVVGAWGKFLQFLTGLAPQGESVSAHLSDLDQVLKFLNVSLAGNSGLNLGTILNQLDPGTANSIQEFVNKLDSHVSHGGINGNINGVDVIVDAGFDIVGGEKITLDVALTLSKVVDAPLNLAAGGDTAGLTIEGDAPVLLTLNASIKFGFEPPDPGVPNSCDSTSFIERAGIKFRAQSVLRDRLIEGRLGFFKLGTKDQFVNSPPEPDEGADIDVEASVEVGLIDPNSSCADGSDNGADGGADLADADCHTDGNVANGPSYDPTRAEDGVDNRISLLEAQATSIPNITRIRPKGHVHAVIPIRTNLFDVTAPESACNDNVDDDRDGKVNDGCPADGAPEEGTACENTTNDDGDGKVNDGCPRSNPRILFDYSLNPGNPNLEFLDMGAVNPFNNLNNVNFLTAMRQLLQWLQSLQSTGVLDTELPFADATLGDVVAVADRLTSALEILAEPGSESPTFTDAEDFQAKFRQALAVALGVPEESLPPIPLDYDHLTRTFTYDLSVSDSFTAGGGEGRTPTCNDGVNNDPSDDPVADENDPDCFVDDDPNDAQPARHVKDAYEDGNCGDGVDNDGAGGADAADPHCHMDNDPSKPVVAGRVEANTCTDGHDNDNDGSADAADPQCKAPLNLAGDFDLFEGVDIQTSGTTSLTAGFDLDLKFGMDLRDFPATPTEGAGAAEDSCRDGLDNDTDSQTDAVDSDCGKREAGGGLGSCTDGQDNNSDGSKDSLALECTLVEGSGGGANSCYDGIDNDNDLFEDLRDGDCTLALEDRLFIITNETDQELRLDLQLNAANVTANAVIGMLEVGVQDADLVIGASEDPTATCGDGSDNGSGDGGDTADPDCHTDSNTGNTASYSAALEEDGVSNADCDDGLDNDSDDITVTGGLLDIVSGGNAADDDGSLLGFQIIDGQVDIDHNGVITEDDDGSIAGEAVIDGKLDLDANGTANDNGSLVLMDENDPDCHVLTVDLTNPDGRLTLPELLHSINNISSLVSADINAFADASVIVGASINNAPIGSGTITANGGITGPVIVNGAEDGGAADTCTDGIDNGDGDEDGDGEDDFDGGDPDCSPLVANLKIDTSGLGDLLDFNTDDPLALLIRLLEIIDGMAEQMQGQENGILGEPIPLVGVSTVEILSYAGELADLLESVRMNPEGNIVCAGQADEDGDGTPNDGCPGVVPVGPPETNKPCEASNSTDEDGDGFVNDGCPANGAPEGDCSDAIDQDSDTSFNDGCPTARPTLRLIENQIEKLLGLFGESDPSNPCGDGSTPSCGSPAACSNAVDDDGDSLVNEGCPSSAAAETGADCLDSVDDDSDTKFNDGCPDNLYIEYLNGEDLVFHLKFGKTASAQGSLDFDLSSLGVDPELIGLITSGQLDATIAGRLDLDFGITIGGSDLGQITPFILDTSGITLSASVDATNFQVQGNVGPLTVTAGNRTEADLGCGAATDEDEDGFFNEGCLADGAAEAGVDCLNSSDNDSDGKVNDGCPANPASLHLGGQFAVDVIGGDAEGKIPLTSLGGGNFNASLTGSNDPDCAPDLPSGTAGACARFKTYIGTQELCEIVVYVPNLASPTFELDDPLLANKQNPSCDFANAIANAALDMLLLESGLGDLLATIEKLLNGDLFGFKVPLIGNLGLGTDFVNSLKTSLVDSVSNGSNPAGEFKSQFGQALLDKVEDFRDVLANALIAENLLMDRGSDGVTVDDLEIVLICGETPGGTPKPCTFGGETDCDDTAATATDEDPLDDDYDGFVNDGCYLPNGYPTTAGGPEADCSNGTDDDDDDGDGTNEAPSGGPVNTGDLVNDGGCAAVGAAETGDQCSNATDDDSADDDAADGGAGSPTVNDGCPAGFSVVGESDGSGDGGPDCLNETDDEDNYPTSLGVTDKDGRINDGCPIAQPSAADVEEIRFFGSIGQANGINPDVGFDLGLPGLGLSSSGAIELGYDWQVNLGFGVSKNQGFFLMVEPMEDGLTTASCSDEDPPNTPKDNDGDGLANDADPDCEPNEFIIGGGVSLDGALVCAKVAFLQATIQDKHTEGSPPPADCQDAPPVNQCTDGIDNDSGGGTDGVDTDCDQDARAEFTINLTDPGTSDMDGRLEFSELIDAPSFDELIQFDLAARVNLSLGITTATDFDNDGQDDPAIPKLLADLNMDWRWSLGDPADPDAGVDDPGALDDNVGTECNSNPADDATEDCFSITFDNLRLDVGTFLASTVGPVAEEIQKYTKPLQPAIDTLTEPIPVLSELAGDPITLLDLVILLGEGDLDFLDDIVAVIEFINSFDASGAAGLVIPLGTPDSAADPNDGGDYDLNGARLLSPLGQATDAFDSPNELDQVNSMNALQKIQDGQVLKSGGGAPSAQQAGLLASLKKLTKEAGVSFPFLEKPADTVQLLFGKDVTLVLWEPPNLKASFAYSQSFGPVWAVPPVFVNIGGSVTIQGHFGLGMDTEGIRALAGGGDAPDLLKGLFLADYDRNGQEVPEFSMRGELFAGASVSVLIFEAGAEGGVFLTINIDLNDPNDDGKMKFAEIQDIILATGNPLCLFVLSGEFGAFLRIFVEVDLFFWSQRWTFTLAEITLLSFSVECDLDPVPNLATRVGNTLWLNMGDGAGADGNIGTKSHRNAFLSIADEEYLLIKNPTTGLIEVKAFGFIECDFDDDGECTVEGDGGITLVKATAGSGDDKIAASPNANRAEDGVQTCGDGVDNSDISNGDPTGNGDGGADQTDDDCHTDGDATDGDSTYRADLAEDGIEACSDGVDNGNDGKADKGTKSNAADPNLPPDPDCSGDPVPFNIPVDFDGGGGEDTLVSDTANDKLKGGPDKDTIQSGKGNDDVIGGTGDDEISTGEGFDVVLGDQGTVGARPGDPVNSDTTVTPAADNPQGSDYVDAGLGTDHVFGQGGNDNIVGGLSETDAVDAADRLHGNDGNDTIDGGDGNDRIFGGNNNDNVTGGGGDDVIDGGDETTAAFADNLGDNLLGGPGADRIFGKNGDDNIVGGTGGDPELRGGNDDDVLLGDEGQIERVAGSVPEDRFDDVVTLTPGPDEGADNMEGGLGDDWLYGQGQADVLKGDGGETEDGAAAGSCDDGIDNGGGDGADSSDANDCDGGNDDLIGGSHDDDLFGGPGADIMLGDDGSVDHVNTAGRSDDTAVLAGGANPGADEMNGDADNDKMFGQDGTDLMNGGGGNDRMNGNGDIDTMNGNAGLDTMFGDPGNDIMRGNQDADVMHGNSGDDHMIGGSPTVGVTDTGDTMYGEVGIDIMVGDNGTISGTDVDLLNLNPIGGNDYMEGNEGNDDMYGGPGLDKMFGQDGDDYMEGNNDRDFMTGAAGEDDMIGGTSKEALDEAGSPPGGGIADGADLMSGGNAVDYMAGDNASIRRPGGDNSRNTYNNAVIRTVELYDVAVAGGPAIPVTVSGGDGMSGDGGDDVMYGGGNGGQGVDNDGDAQTDEDPVDNADTDKDGNEDGSSATPGTGTCNNGIDEGADGKDASDPQCAPFIDEDPGGDVMHGNAGDDYVEGNAGGDIIFGDANQDDLIGGTGRRNTADQSTAQDGRLDGGDIMWGGDGSGGVAEDDFDVVVGDNATIDRPLDGGGLWQINAFNSAVKREIRFYDVGMSAPGSPAAAGTNGDDTIRGENDDDLLYGQGGGDNMQGNSGDDYMEGNDGADEMQGNDGNDDMAGGTGRIFQGNVQDPPEGRDGRLDTGETGMSGGNGFDFMIGDNGVITRTLDSGGAWMSNTFHVCSPLSDCNGVQHNPVVLRDVQLLGVPVGAGTSGGEQNMMGDDQDDIMYGQGGGDEMFGGNGEDYMEGNHDGDDMFGNAGEDDMLGGGSDDSNLANTSEPDLLDGDDIMRGEGDFSDGAADGDNADAMIGDNGTVVRPLGSLGEWQTVPANGTRLRVVTIFDVELAGSPLSLTLSGDDDIYGNDNDDTMYGQAGEDDMYGGSGDDYMEGNAHSDTMYGGPEQDDMIGGTARTTSNLASTFVAGRTDVSTKTRSVPLGRNMATVPLGDTMHGGDGADEMSGDNLQITRPLTSGQWTVLSYSLQLDSVGDVGPRHAAGGPSSRVDRATLTVDVTPGATAGSDLMYGGNGDDNMFGQFDDTLVAVAPAGLFVEESHECSNGVDDDADGTADDGCSPNIGDEMYGDAGEDAMAGDQGTFDDRVLPSGSAQDIAPNEPFIADNIYVDNTLFREFKLGQVTGFDKTGLNDKGGYDRMKGGDGGDWMHGGAGSDLMNGDRGNDRLFGDNGDDTMWGGAQHDHLWGGFNHDHMDVHPVVTEPDSLTCNKPAAPINPATHDPLEQYTFGFADGDTACDGNLEDVDFMYGGWNQDTMEANVGDNGPRVGDRLIDWVGVFNLYILCPGTYGEFVSTREFSPTLTTFLHNLAAADGAFQPGPLSRTTAADPSGFNEIAFVYKADLKSNQAPPHTDTPAHFNCSADSTTIP